jgi:hypothetical protein
MDNRILRIIVNKTVEDNFDEICDVMQEEINKKDDDVVYVAAVTALLGVSAFSLWFVWDLIMLVWGE